MNSTEHSMKATITKTSGDYIDSASGQLRTGQFWKIEVDGLTIRRAGSKTRGWVVDHIRNNFGSDVEIEEI